MPGRRPVAVRGIAGGDRDAEVAQAGVAVGREPDVVGLDVAVDDAVLVGVGERVGQRAAGAEHLRDRQAPPGRRREPLGQRAARHVAGDDVQHAAVLDRVVDGHDVRVVAEPRHQARLAPHPLARDGSGEAVTGAGDRDRAVEREVVRQPHLLRPAAAEHALSRGRAF